MRLCFDLETTNLLNSNSVDYTASPYCLKDDFKVHCAVFIDVDTDIEYVFVGDELKTVKTFILKNATELIGHNIINFDLMVLKAAYGIDFEIGVFEGKDGKFHDYLKDSICGKPITITDTLVMSKTLNPDRLMHSIEYFGKMHGEEKIDWRAKAIELGLITHDAPKGAEFLQYHPEMLVYNKQDVRSNIKTWKFLLREWGDWNWKPAYELEKAVAEIITRQEHRGFFFNQELAIECVRDLDEKMEILKAIVEPLIPPKSIGKTAAKEFIPPKIQFKKDGSLSANIQKWVDKHNGKIESRRMDYFVTVFDKEYKLPMPLEPVKTHMPSTIKDVTHLKGWMVGLGWFPSMYKERDITVDYKKHKLSKEKYIEVCDRYIEQTLSSPFKEHRLEYLEVNSDEAFKKKLYNHDHTKRPLKVYTNPSLTVGAEKEIDPALLLIQDKFAHAKDVSHYLTYSHRRNSILGGGVDPDDEEEEAEKGWLSVDRLQQDGRIPTPADTCGCNTSRFKHRVVANIPRVSSLYGPEMRALFGTNVEKGFFQLGYDFASLEAMIEAHYTWKYDGDEKEYCKSLLQAKPNSVHCITARKISEMLCRAFPRDAAKTLKYAAAYGAGVARIAKTVGCSMEDAAKIREAYWLAAQPLGQLSDNLRAYWEKTGGKKFIIGIDGRKIPTRSASALINSLFQSAGIICAKYAMVLHDKKMKAEGLSVDFWKDDWKNSYFVQQLIAYHDECALEVHKSFIKWKLFQTEDEAKAFKADNPTWSEIGHSVKGYYVGWCKVGEMLKEIMEQTSKHFKLNVTLRADYILGRNWAETH